MTISLWWHLLQTTVIKVDQDNLHKDQVCDKNVIFEHIRTEPMIVDPLNKALSVATLKGHMKLWDSLKNECSMSLLHTRYICL